MINIDDLRENPPVVISIGSHPGIVQSIIDYDFLVKKQEPSVVAIIASGKKQERYFWGETEITIPVVPAIDLLKSNTIQNCTAIINVQSARRVLSSTKEAITKLPNLRLITVFAEQTPESHTIELIDLVEKKNIILVGPSSVGVLLPGYSKLGAIGGTQHEQLSDADILKHGDTAVISTSGGIVNELIHTVTNSGLGVSFAIAIGGDRFPVLTPLQAVLLAQHDRVTKRIVFFGELGGIDEYEIAEHIRSGIIKKEVIVYIAGTVAELFEVPPQFGHAKALAQSQDESASAKKEALRNSGAVVCDSFGDIEVELRKRVVTTRERETATIGKRNKAMMMSHISGEKDGTVRLLGADLLDMVDNNSIASLITSMLFGDKINSVKMIAFIDHVFKLLVDHGPYVSGAVNTIITARAGKDLASSLAAGLLTVGPRFGGAINAAAKNFLDGIYEDVTAREFVESFASKGGIIPGIGHKKYHINLPDPRIKSLMQFTKNHNGDRFLHFALGVEEITSSKKSNLILNVDGAIAAIFLDIIESELNYSRNELQELVDIEFFNALFILSRSVGFTSHYLDQRRHDEGLFRMAENDIRYIE